MEVSDYGFVTSQSLVVPYVRDNPGKFLVVTSLPVRLSPHARQQIRRAEVLFLKTDLIQLVIPLIHGLLRHDVVFITHNSDYGIGSAARSSGPAQNAATFNMFPYLTSPKVAAWFGVNCQANHPKLHPIPLGIANSQYEHGSLDTLSRVSRLTIARTNICYAAFSCHTNVSERTSAKVSLEQNGIPVIDTSIKSSQMPYEVFLTHIRQSKTVACPTGNGTDCHRAWEALYLGAVPIVPAHAIWHHFSSLGVPLLIVDDYSVVSPGWIEKRLHGLSYDPSSLRPISQAYWNEQIRSFVSGV